MLRCFNEHLKVCFISAVKAQTALLNQRLAFALAVSYSSAYADGYLPVCCPRVRSVPVASELYEHMPVLSANALVLFLSLV